VATLTALAARLRADVEQWRGLALEDLLYSRRAAALTACLVLLGLSIGALIVRSMLRRSPGHNRIVLPAVLARSAASRSAWLPGLSGLRYVPLALFLTGFPFFMIALADPYRAVAVEQVSYPGRRIALLLDASSSMMVPFPSSRLRDASTNEAVFLTNVAAAEAFVRHRQGGKYRDLIALVEFGDEAYVITPFTNDYDNVLLSLSLVGDWNEYMQFPDGGTAIGRAIDRGTGLFRAFDFLHASGNLMVIFSDGQDTQVSSGQSNLSDVLAAAVATRIPVYLVRTNRGKALGDVVPDGIWKPAVEATGGRFYAAASESDVIRAIEDIDRRSAGTIEMKRYGVRQPQFGPFASMTVGLWMVGLILKLTIPLLTRFP
jgi:hypothetical protein